MLAARFDPIIQRGGTWSIDVTAKDQNGSARDFSVYDSMRMHVRPPWVGKPGTVRAAPLITLSTTTGEITFPNNTTIRIGLAAAVTEKLKFNSGAYELEMIKNATADTPEIVDKLLYGIISVTKDL